MKETIDRNFDSVTFTALILTVLVASLGFVAINKHHQQAMADKGYIEQPLPGTTSTIWVKDNGCY